MCRPFSCCAAHFSPRCGHRQWGWMLSRAALTVASAVVGALPWLWANFHSGFASLHAGAYPEGPHRGTRDSSVGYGSSARRLFRCSSISGGSDRNVGCSAFPVPPCCIAPL